MRKLNKKENVKWHGLKMTEKILISKNKLNLVRNENRGYALECECYTHKGDVRSIRQDKHLPLYNCCP